MEELLADASVAISELQQNPTLIVDGATDRPVAILNHDKPVAYLISANAWEAICDVLEDINLAEIIREREAGPFTEVSINDL